MNDMSRPQGPMVDNATLRKELPNFNDTLSKVTPDENKVRKAYHTTKAPEGDGTIVTMATFGPDGDLTFLAAVEMSDDRVEMFTERLKSGGHEAMPELEEVERIHRDIYDPGKDVAEHTPNLSRAENTPARDAEDAPALETADAGPDR